MRNTIINYEEAFSRANKGVGIMIKKGNIPILISTPHSVPQIRDGKYKEKEVFTGGIGQYLQKQTDCFLIQSLASENQDPNYDSEENSKYKAELTQQVLENNIKLVIDLHGCKRTTPYLIELGTVDDTYKTLNHDEKLLNIIKETLEEKLKIHHQTPVVVNQRFKAFPKNTITHYINDKIKVKSIQMEVNAKIRDFYNEETVEQSTRFVETMVNLILELNDYLKREED